MSVSSIAMSASSFNAASPQQSNEERSLTPSAAVDLTTEKLAGRYRRLRATITVPRPQEQVWQILTDYERLADFIPNLTVSRRLSHPENGIRLEQVGAQCFLNFQFCARVVLDMMEQFPNRLSFQMVEGDFKDFQGFWGLETVQTASAPETRLTYDLTVRPPLALPIRLIERHLQRDLAENMQAIRQQAIVQFAA